MSRTTQTVLVVGSSGFVGHRLSTRLLSEGLDVRCLARDTDKVRDLAEAGCQVIRGDMLQPSSIVDALESVQAVYVCVHTLASQGASRASRHFMDLERAGLQNVVDAAASAGTNRLVYVTSIGVTPDAPSAWARGRAQIEQELFSSGLAVTVIRPGMIVGRGGAGFDSIARGARGPVAMVLGPGSQQFRTIALDDLVYYLIGVLDEPGSFGRRFDVGSDDVLTVPQMIDIAAGHLRRRHPLKVHLPVRLLSAVAPAIERVAGTPRGAIRGLLDSLTIDMGGDPALIRGLLPRTPLSYREALDHALDHTAR